VSGPSASAQIGVGPLVNTGSGGGSAVAAWQRTVGAEQDARVAAQTGVFHSEAVRIAEGKRPAIPPMPVPVVNQDQDPAGMLARKATYDSGMHQHIVGAFQAALAPRR